MDGIVGIPRDGLNEIYKLSNIPAVHVEKTRIFLSLYYIIHIPITNTHK